MPIRDERSDPATTPLLLVDVDGVLNAVVGTPFGARKEMTASMPFEAEFEASGLPIRVPAGTRERIEALQTLFDCVWATTWEDRARSELAPVLGFGADWPVIRFKDDFPDSGTWKLPAVQRYAERPEHRDRPLAWIDDDLEPDALEWAAWRSRSGPRTLMVRPDADLGFTSRHFRRLLAFHADCQPLGEVARPASDLDGETAALG
jgi:hypothetical protein